MTLQKSLRNSDLISRTASRFSINARSSQWLQAESLNHYLELFVVFTFVSIVFFAVNWVDYRPFLHIHQKQIDFCTQYNENKILITKTIEKGSDRVNSCTSWIKGAADYFFAKEEICNSIHNIFRLPPT